ncbi:hypothetical protein ADIARSV_4025 [Arcticibacter svalbardensis MN12-7]|uniref:Phosphoinositide phospholipase C, Ca2+-dependent n=1 Tax=Arcticibacter svalbardensis MN12-7 TaxID=1150600 RepID=R9GV55_9SPHI|nr:Ca2+-dependent phosphoinositide-specific phospholipase C [Arcticibacter svalbardensis]EOR92814.1 hypothetical protein ADIARSV_4025 [Arcticibacter svalbardensis MN12-7]
MKTTFLKIILCLVTLGNFQLASAQEEADKFKGLHLNEVQLIGSHNSYKPGIEPALWKIVYKRDSAAALALQYGHISFTKQLDLGLRNLEIDVVYDPLGGIYKNPLGIKLLKNTGVNAEPYDLEDNLSKPGLKVFHIPDIDFRSNHLLFVDCLKELKEWSASHPGHLPIIITMNTKDSNEKSLKQMLPFNKAALDNLDIEIKSVLEDKQLITPDFVRGEFSNLNAAVTAKGWPLISDLKGRFLFVLDETGKKMEAYKNGHPSLKGRVLFVNDKPGSPESAFLIMNNPKRDGEKIDSLAAKGYLIRTRADANTVEARNNDFTMFDAAKKKCRTNYHYRLLFTLYVFSINL